MLGSKLEIQSKIDTIYLYIIKSELLWFNMDDIGKSVELYGNSEALKKPLNQMLQAQPQNKKVEDQREYFLKISQKLNLKIQISIKNTYIESQGFILHANGSPFKIHPSYVQLVSEILNEKEIGKYGKVTYARNKNILMYRVYLKIKQTQTLTSQQIETFNRVNAGYCLKFHDTLTRLGLLKQISLQRATFISNTLKFLKSAFIIFMEHRKQIRKPQIARSLKKAQKRSGIQKQRETEDIEVGSIFKRCYKIIQSEEECPESKAQKKTGGYFSVLARKCVIEGKKSQQRQEKVLAIKSLNVQKAGSIEKIERERRILQRINDRKHFLTYYLPQIPRMSSQSQQTKIYMEFCERTLNHEIYSSRSKIHTILDLSNQLLQGVSTLHHSGIVHRDLKPQNFLVTHSQHDKKQKILKIIDFGQSAIKSSDFESSGQVLGYTLPYSPIECMVLQKEGYNKEEIDIWSIGVLLYEMMFKMNPLSTSKCFLADIYNGWSIDGQFQSFLKVEKKPGIRILESIVGLTCYFCLQIKQKHRMDLDFIQRIYKLILQFFHNLP